MKIDTGIKTKRAEAKTKVKKNASASSAFSSQLIGLTQEASHSHQTEKTQSIHMIDSLLSLQEADPEKSKKKKMIMSAQHILNELDTLKHALLSGNISAHDIQSIHRSLHKMDLSTQDRELQILINDIKIRAEVEIAKLENQ